MKSWETTVIGILIGVGALCAAGVSLLDGDPMTNPDLEGLMTAITGVLITLGFIRARDNNKTSKEANAKKGTYLPMLVFLLAVGLVCGGCASTGLTEYKETSWQQGVDGELYENTFSARAKSKAGAFGEVPEAVHDISSQWGGDEPSHLQVGQTATIDNTAQADVAILYGQIAGTVVGNVLNQLISAFAANPDLLKALIAPEPAPAPASPVE